ncbi:hypothetical protein F5B18DRAFT_570033 [Nemania serpens]|nr:hypothetical protein F5B18DRAFT_570033 [Nemania serpens]
MANANIPMDMEHIPIPISIPVMGMTAKEYQTAFTYLEHADFAREIEEYRDQRRRATAPRPIRWYERYELWAIVLAAISLAHAGFVQWVWPGIQKDMQGTASARALYEASCPPAGG